MTTSNRLAVGPPALAIYVFLGLGALVPAWLYEATGGLRISYSATPQLLVMVLVAARYAWLVGSRTRHLYEMIFWLFAYVFMGMAPYVQLRQQMTPGTTPYVDWVDIPQASAIVLVGCFAVIVGSWVGRRKAAAPVARRRIGVRVGRSNFLALFALAFAAYYVSRIGMAPFFSSRTKFDMARTQIWADSTISVMVSGGVAMSLLVAFVAQIHIRQMRKRAGRRGPALLPLVIAATLLFVVNPISSPRYVFGTVALSMLAALGVYATPARFRSVAIMAPIALVGVFPLLDAFRYTEEAADESGGAVMALTGGDFDAFAQVVNTVSFVGANGIEWGRQLLGVILFWVPRSMWEDKPIDTGSLLAQFKEYSFENLSAPIWAELFINGGWVLLLLGMLAMGYAFRVLDGKSEFALRVGGIPPVLSCIIPAYMLLLLRGSLLAAMAYLSVILLCALFVSDRRRIRRTTPLRHPHSRTEVAQQGRV